jgi:uncharacterized protein YegL
MPIITTEEINKIPGSSFQFSAVKPENLGASEYTLVTVVIDITGSVYMFSKELLIMLQEVIKACQKNARSENLMVRVVTFNNHVNEEHGFRLLMDIDPANYHEFNCTGNTALYDATYSSIAATLAYADTLMKNNFNVNGAIYIITDGEDNASNTTRKMISDEIEKCKKTELIESLITILIGINSVSCKQYLDGFKQEAGLSQYVNMGEVTAGKLAKLAGFISKSISSQSRAIGSGISASTNNLTF